jgi:glycosyltransferase involved in cell wall biosynthesis
MPIVSVIMPVYNCEAYIRESLESILNQTIADFEFLIIDDASKDKTADLIKCYNDPRIHLIEKPVNTGYSNSLNLGIKLAKGKYIARMDGDDISLPERFAKQVAFLERNPEVVACGSFCYRMGENKIVFVPEKHESIKLTLLKENAIVHPSVMMRKDALDELSMVYDVGKEPAEDYHLWVRLLLIGKLHNLQEVLLNYRVHNTQVTKKRNEQQLNSATSSKLELLKYLNLKINAEEREVFKKIFLNKAEFTINEIEIFQRLKDKLIAGNVEGFFEQHGFQEYLIYLENRLGKKVLASFCIERKKFSPLIFFQYLKLKKKWKYKLDHYGELKLFIKSIIFYQRKTVNL